MIRLINATTGTDMWVSEKRVAEYLSKGHKPFEDVPPAPPAKPTAPPPKTKKASTTKK
jgi:hypothetical protein